MMASRLVVTCEVCLCVQESLHQDVKEMTEKMIVATAQRDKLAQKLGQVRQGLLSSGVEANGDGMGLYGWHERTQSTYLQLANMLPQHLLASTGRPGGC